MKLEYINKRHLMRTWSTPEGLESLAKRVHGRVKEAFSSRSVIQDIGDSQHLTRITYSQYTTVGYIKHAILTLEVYCL